MDWPKCDYDISYVQSQGISEYCRDGTLIIKCRNHATGKEWEKERGLCPVCNGTGEAQNLTANQADKYLRAQNYQYTRTRVGGLLVRRNDGGHTFVIDGEPNLTAALNAAAHVIYERNKK